jgi:hypothetical protein
VGKATILKNVFKNVLMMIVIVPVVVTVIVAIPLALTLNIVIWDAALKNSVFTAILIIVYVAMLSLAIISTYLQRKTLGEKEPRLPAPKENEVAFQVLVDSSNPLVLSVNVKSSYRKDIKFLSGYIQDSKMTNVAQWPRAESIGSAYDVYAPAPITLPANSERTFTLDFNTTLPSGIYTLWLLSNYKKDMKFFSLLKIP